MWQDANLKNFLETTSSVTSKALVLAEWNLNYADNIEEIGNYRYRPTDEESTFYTIKTTYEKETALTATKHYYGATNSDTVVDGGYDDDNLPITFISQKEKTKRLFSLEDCFGRFRPRSGINKFVYFPDRYLTRSSANMAQQPRYYFPSMNDNFKYWTSFRTEGVAKTLTASISDVEVSKQSLDKNGDLIRYTTKFIADNDFQIGDYVSITSAIPSIYNGNYLIISASSTSFKVAEEFAPATAYIANSATATVTTTREEFRGFSQNNGVENTIDDTAPFIVYKNQIATNRIVVKMQTNVGTIDLGPYKNDEGDEYDDPFYGEENKTVPKDWKIQYLNSNNEWVDAKTFDSEFSIPSDGYVELAYGLNNIPETYQDNIVFAPEIASIESLPIIAPLGYAWLVTDGLTAGTYYVSNGQENNDRALNYDTFVPTYEWYVNSETPSRTTNYVKEIVDTRKYGTSPNIVYRDFQYIKGLRIVVDTMNKNRSTFDLIELSPRLAVDLSDRTMNFSIDKHASDLGNSGMPVGQLLSSTGNITLFDYDQAFNQYNTDSIVAGLSTKNLQFKIYESIFDNDGYVYHIPIKTMYADGFPEKNNTDKTLSITLKDLFFYFDSMTAQQLLIPEASLSFAVSSLLDSIGFSNYTFKRIGTNEPKIPYFFIGPDTTVAQVLQNLAVSTQTAMFFDEYNNFVLMNKEYMMPGTEEDRATDLTLVGSENYVAPPSVYSNKVDSVDTTPVLANIQAIESETADFYNDGKIVYTNRYMQREVSTLNQATKIDAEKNWVYKPVLLWEITPDKNTKATNEEVASSTAYSLSAIPLAYDLSADVPVVVNGKVTKNIMSFGEAVYWISRYNGYFFANGEIIKYDAVEYSVQGTGNVWISDVQEYQKYFASLPFGGKIYPTGNVRIYSEPYYDATSSTGLKEGAVASHGRGQFGTSVVYHKSDSAGDNGYWVNESNVKMCYSQSKYLIGSQQTPATVSTPSKKAGVLTASALNIVPKAKVSSFIKNFLSNKYISETELTSIDTITDGVVQASALVMSGPSYNKEMNTSEIEKDFAPTDFISYIPKDLGQPYRTYGTRMRIVGTIENSNIRTQTPSGAMPFYSVQNTETQKDVIIGGASGGIAIMLNKTTNVGYYFEIAALTNNNINSYEDSVINNVFFYKIQPDSNGKAIPVTLWSGFTSILTDDGNFTGQSRMIAEDNPTVYDLSIDYQYVGKSIRFVLYINNKPVGSYLDKSPLTKTNNIALFVRGSSKCMFENVYAISENYNANSLKQDNALTNVLNKPNPNDSFSKYSMPLSIQSTFLKSINSVETPHILYYEEFGTIMREMAYFNVRYDKAYPALTARIAPTFNDMQGYSVSGFNANAYGAEFMIFNTTDTVVNLDDTSGNFLRILGTTFTQQSSHELTVDDYFSKRSNLSDPVFGEDNKAINEKTNQVYSDIKTRRMTYGKKEFTINAPYLQSEDDANLMMGWLSSKIMSPRKSVGLNVFSTPTIQLGDVVKINYKEYGLDQVSQESSRFVVYSIRYERGGDGPSMSIYLSQISEEV